MIDNDGNDFAISTRNQAHVIVAISIFQMPNRCGSLNGCVTVNEPEARIHQLNC